MAISQSRPPAFWGEMLTVAAALIMLAAFLFLPWYALDDDGGMVTAYRITADTEGDLDLAGRMSHVFLILIPLAAVSALLLAGWRTQKPGQSTHIPGLILLVGLMGVGYYYGAFFFENRQQSTDAVEFIGVGFYVALFAGLGLIIQYAIPREGISMGVQLTAVTLPAIGQPRAWWGWPFTWLRGLLGWIGALLGWALAQLRRLMAGTPLLAYLLGLWAAFELEQREAASLAKLLAFRRNRPPTLFGAAKLMDPFELDFSGILAPFFPAPSDDYAKPLNASWSAIRDLGREIGNALVSNDPREPGFFEVLGDVVIYDVIMYVIPVLMLALLLKPTCNWLLKRMPFVFRLGLQLGILYLAVAAWRGLNDYRELVLIYMGINIMLTVSLNLVNGYMGEFSVGHAGFMAVGAYVSSILTMWLFIDESVFGDAVLTESLPGVGLFIGFLIALIAGGIAAAIAGLMVAFPSFRTRGDYLAIVTLAVNFIVTGFINTQEWIGGPRGLRGVPIWTTLPWVFFLTVLSILAIYNLVTSTFGKGIIAIREDEIAAELMGVNTRRVKLVTFLVSSFIAGMSGGLFAHYLAYVNPGTFDILKSTEALVMVYLGGMGSISGSIIAAVIFTILIEALRPLGVLKWVLIPLTLILLMLYRPQGLFGFREINVNFGSADDDASSASAAPQEVADDTVAH